MKHKTITLISFIFFTCNMNDELPVFDGELIDMINQVNPGYIIDDRLMKAAEIQVNYLNSLKTIQHDWADGTDLADRLEMVGFPGAAGECNARGHKTGASVMEGWMKSSEHRKIIMGVYNRVGYARKNDYWCLVVGQR